jgi:hypothetical protein
MKFFDFDAFKRWCGQVDRRDDAMVGGAVAEIERLRSALYCADGGCNYVHMYDEFYERSKIIAASKGVDAASTLRKIGADQ